MTSEKIIKVSVMHRPHRKTIRLLMLILFFVMSVGAYGFNLKRFSHELDHDRQTRTASINHDHAPRLDAKSNPAAEPSNDAEHETVARLEPLRAIFPIRLSVTLLSRRLLGQPSCYRASSLCSRQNSSPPFRPPRSASPRLTPRRSRSSAGLSFPWLDERRGHACCVGRRYKEVDNENKQLPLPGGKRMGNGRDVHPHGYHAGSRPASKISPFQTARFRRWAFKPRHCRMIPTW
jgi:hypothetical protein